MSVEFIDQLKDVTSYSEVEEIHVLFRGASGKEKKKIETDLLKLLVNGRADEFVRSKAAELLGASDNKALVRKTLLERLCTEKSGLVRGRIALALARSFDGDDRIEAIANQLGEERSVITRRMMSRALCEVESEAAVPTLLQLVNEPDTKIRHQVIKALGNQKITEAIPVLTERLNEETEETEYITQAILRALTAIKNENALKVFIEYLQLKDRKVDIYIAALRGLKELDSKDENVINALLEAVCHENIIVSTASTDLLAEMLGAKNAAIAIARFGMEQASLDQQKHIANALRIINDKGSILYLKSLQEDTTSANSNRAQMLLQEIGGEQAVDALLSHRLNVLQKAGNRVEEFDKQALSIFHQTVAQATRGFDIHLGMSVGIFFIGLILLLISIAQLVATDREVWQYVSGTIVGGGGFATILAIFYIGPLERVQNAVANLVQTEIVFLGYIRQVTQISAMFEREYLNNEKFDLAELKKMLGFTERTIKETMPLVQTYTAVSLLSSDDNEES